MALIDARNAHTAGDGPIATSSPHCMMRRRRRSASCSSIVLITEEGMLNGEDGASNPNQSVVTTMLAERHRGVAPEVAASSYCSTNVGNGFGPKAR